MKETIQKGISFIRENPSLIYSLLLIIFLPLALLGNNYYTLISFQNNKDGVIDKLLQKKAMAIENVLGITISDLINQPDKLQEKINQIKNTSSDIIGLEISVPVSEGFKVIASFKENEINQIKEGVEKNLLAFVWGYEEGGIARLKQTGETRFWETAKTIFNNRGEKIAVIAMSFSLTETDNLVKKVVLFSYLILAITIIILLLLVANHTRLFGYALLLNKLKEADKMKDDFISMASHELRTPLTALRGYLEFFKDRNKDKVDQSGEQDLKNMEVAVSRLNNLVNDILEVSRLQQNRIPFNFEKIEPSSVIETSINELRPQASQKGLLLNYEKKPLPQIFVDKDRLKQILVNLIGNAIYYTKEGKVEVLTKAEGGKVFITVTDTGIGISAEEQKKLFQKFYRVKNKATSDIPGTGLGLWISLQFAQKMKGNISVESIEGVGSHFIIEFPEASS